MKAPRYKCDYRGDFYPDASGPWVKYINHQELEHHCGVLEGRQAELEGMVTEARETIVVQRQMLKELMDVVVFLRQHFERKGVAACSNSSS